MRFIHTADIHLGAQPQKGHPLSEIRKQEIWDSFEGLLDMVRTQAVPLLLIAGDLFHRQPLKSELRKVDDWFAALPDTEVVLIAGNHDYISRQSYYRDFAWNGNVHFLGEDRLQRVYLEQLNTYVYGLSYHSREIRENLYDSAVPGNEPGAHILLAHGGDEKHIPISWNRLEHAGFTYVALGHIHKPQEVRGEMAYAGALEPIDRNDTGVHGYIDGEIDARGVRAKLMPCASRIYVDLEVRVNRSMSQRFVEEKVDQQIQRRGREHFYTLRLTGERSEDRVYDTARLMQLGNVLDVRDATHPVIDYVHLYEKYQGTILGEYITSFAGDGHLPPADSVEGKALCYGVQALMGVI